MLEQMRKEYDYVFIDCPPIDIIADANIVTEFVDMTVLVMRSNLMNKDVLPVIEELYHSGKFSHMALILNGVELKFRKYGYGRSGYGYGYGYANDDEE